VSFDRRAVRWATACDVPRALDWLETAMRLRIPDLALVKLNPLFDPLRKQPRFQAIERELKFRIENRPTHLQERGGVSHERSLLSIARLKSASSRASCCN